MGGQFGTSAGIILSSITSRIRAKVLGQGWYEFGNRNEHNKLQRMTTEQHSLWISLSIFSQF